MYPPLHPSFPFAEKAFSREVELFFLKDISSFEGLLSLQIENLDKEGG